MQSPHSRLSALLLLTTLLAGCGSAGGVVSDVIGIPEPPLVHEAVYDRDTGRYEYSGDLTIEDPPTDADWTRWAMCHDGSRKRLFVMRDASPAQVYMFVNLSGRAFTYVPVGNGSIPLTGVPSDASLASIAAVHGQGVTRLYMRSRSRSDVLYQFGLTVDAPVEFRFGFDSIGGLLVRGFPADADFRRWAMHEDGSYYRFMVFKEGSTESLYQGAFNYSTATYDYGHKSRDVVSLSGFPQGAYSLSGASLYDGGNWRFYQLGR